MRTTISSAYPADDIISIIGLVVCVAFVILVAALIAIDEKKRYRGKHAAPISHMLHYAEADVALTEKLYQKDLLRFQKEQDAKDQETLDRATEYHNGI